MWVPGGWSHVVHSSPSLRTQDIVSLFVQQLFSLHLVFAILDGNWRSRDGVECTDDGVCN